MKVRQVSTGTLAGTFEVLHDGLVFSTEHPTNEDAQSFISVTVAKALEDVQDCQDRLRDSERWWAEVAMLDA